MSRVEVPVKLSSGASINARRITKVTLFMDQPELRIETRDGEVRISGELAVQDAERLDIIRDEYHLSFAFHQEFENAY